MKLFNWSCEDNSDKHAGTIVAALVAAGGMLSGGLVHAYNLFDDDDSPPANRNADSSRWVAPGRDFHDPRSSERIVDLRGDWAFSIGDDSSWAQTHFDDSTWGKVHVPDNWESQGAEGYDGFAWYRRSFSLSGLKTDEVHYLRLGRIDDADEVFLNGVRIGGTGMLPPDYETAWDAQRTYDLPRELLNESGENVLAVRVFDERLGGGIVAGTVGIYRSTLPAPLVNLSGWWRLKAHDDPGFRRVECDVSSFSRVQVPGAWDQQGLADFDGHAWYRKTFDFPTPATADRMVMMLGRIDDADEAYLNGVLIGQTGTDTDSYRKRRAYAFDAALLRPTGNVLAVRVYDGQDWGGITDGPIGIMSVENHDRYWELRSGNRRQVWTPIWNWLLGRG